MNLKSRINQLIKKTATKEQINPELEVLDFSSMSDEELKKFANGEGSITDFSFMTDAQLRAIIAGNYKVSKNGEYEFFIPN